MEVIKYVVITVTIISVFIGIFALLGCIARAAMEE